MAIKKSVTVNFFRSAFDGEKAKTCRFHDILQSVSKLPHNKRVRPMGSDHFMLGEYKQLAKADHEIERWVGQVRRQRINDRVAEGNDDGYYDDVQLSKGYVTESGHFMVIPRYKAILFQGNSQEVGWTRLRKYIESFANEEDRLVMVPILDKEKVKLLNRIARPKKFSLKVANPEKWSLIDDPSTRDSTAIAMAFDADWMTIELGTDRGRKNFMSTDILSWPSKLLRFASSDEKTAQTLKTLTIEGYEKEGAGEEKVAIDFIQDRVQYHDKIDMATVTKVKHWTSECYRLLQRAYDKQGGHVRKGFN